MTETMTFKEINKIDVSDHVEQKMNLSYLSWAWAHQEMMKIDDQAEITIHEYPDTDLLNQLASNGVQITKDIIDSTKINYRKDSAGAYVSVSVKLNGKTQREYLPVMDFKNKAMVQPSAMDINKAHKRCFVKALALHGLGLYIYAGEDLPEADSATPEQVKALKDKLSEMKKLLESNEDIEKISTWFFGKLGTNKVENATENNAKQVIGLLDRMIEKQKKEKEPTTLDV